MGRSATIDSSLPSVEVVSNPARLRALGGQWTDLWSRSSAGGLFQSFEYCMDAWDVVEQPEGSQLACLVGWHGDRMVAVWPFVTYRDRLWRHARPLVASGVELHELLCDETVDRPRWVRQAFDALVAAARPDVVDLSFFPEGPDGPALSALSGRVVEAGGVASVRVDLRSEVDWDAYYNSLSKSYRKDFAKARRRLESLGTVDLAVLEAGDARLGSLVDWTLTQKRVWAGETGKQGRWLYSDRYRRFLDTQLARPGSSARNVLLTLTVDGTLIATQIGAVGKGTFTAVIAGFDPEYKKHSPGARMTESMLRWAWEQGLDCDLGAGTEPYKTFWSRGRETPIATRRIAVSRWGVAASVVRRSARQIAAWRDGRRRPAAP